ETVAPRSVALVVTSPPYYSGKEYEAAIGEGHVPASYREYLAMLRGVFGACVDKLEPGGRVAVNVANLGRKPYRSLSADVISILEELGLLLRGEIIWRKAKGAAGNCAWGTYQRPGDPVLRDVTERVVVASKGRFDRALPPAARAAAGLPSEATMYRDDFLEATLDVWDIPPERATRVGHPAPFPVDLPQRLIDLYTYRGDIVLDPFMGSGSTAVAALRTGRHFVGYDTDAGYVTACLERIKAERAELDHGTEKRGPTLPAVTAPSGAGETLSERAVREGRRAKELARWLLEEAGFTVTATDKHLGAGVDVTFVATDHHDRQWLFEVVGTLGRTAGGLPRADVLWRTLGKAAVVQHTLGGTPFVVLAADKPKPASAAGRALAAVVGSDPATKPVYDVISLLDPADAARLSQHARSGLG
ncbi:MAG TPA: DNA methyltransferase, partial [Acidimicrobiales bacterium]|nr:DNA methyltransferase [Acidimicrobiales bacterium]